MRTGDGRRDWTDRHSAVTKLDVKGIFDTEVDHRISDSPWYKPDFDSHACRDELCGQKASGTSSAVVPSSGLITMVEKIGTSSTIEVWTVESDATDEVCAQRDQAARGHPGNRAERETCPSHPLCGLDPLRHVPRKHRLRKKAQVRPQRRRQSVSVIC